MPIFHCELAAYTLGRVGEEIDMSLQAAPLRHHRKEISLAWVSSGRMGGGEVAVLLLASQQQQPTENMRAPVWAIKGDVSEMSSWTLLHRHAKQHAVTLA